MKAVATDQNGKISIVEIPIPHYGEYECLVKIKACGICNSTDMKLIKNQFGGFNVEYPALLGHESVGEVVEVGSKVTKFKKGDRVVNPLGRLEDGTPYHSTWTEMTEYAIAYDVWAMERDGVEIPPELELETLDDCPTNFIPEGMSYVDAAVLLTVKENYSAMKNFGMSEGKEMLIFGDGPVAFGLSSMAKILGAKYIVCAGHHDDRLAVLKEKAHVDVIVNTKEKDLAEVIGDHKFDMIVDAVGRSEVIKENGYMLKPGGKICMYGVLSNEQAKISLIDMPNNSCLHMLNRPYGEYRSHDEVCELVKAGKINLKDFYSHVLPLEKAAEGFELVKKREAYKVILSME